MTGCEYQGLCKKVHGAQYMPEIEKYCSNGNHPNCSRFSDLNVYAKLRKGLDSFLAIANPVVDLLNEILGLTPNLTEDNKFPRENILKIDFQKKNKTAQ